MVNSYETDLLKCILEELQNQNRPDTEFEIEFLCDPTDNGTVMIETYREDGVKQPVTYTKGGLPWAGDPADLVVCDDVNKEAELVEICIGGTDKGFAIIPLEDGIPSADPIAFKDDQLANIPEPASWTAGKCDVEQIRIDIMTDCDGTVDTIDGDSIVQSVPHPKSVQMVKICPEDSIETHVEFVCDEDANEVMRVVTITTNGVPGTPVVTGTGIACDEDPDMEIRSTCDPITKTVREQLVIVAENGTETNVGDPVDTFIPCDENTDIFLGNTCFDTVEVSEDAPSEALIGNSGTLSDGTTYTIVNNDGGNIIYGTTDGDIRWENSQELEITFSNPVNLVLSNTVNAAPILNPIVWSRGATPLPNFILQGPFTFATGNGEIPTYAPGNVPATLKIVDDSAEDTTGQNFKRGLGFTAQADVVNSGAPNASQDWGVLTLPKGTVFRVGGRDAEAMNFQAIPTTLSGDVQTLKTIRKADGTIEHLDSEGNVVDTSTMVEVPCTVPQEYLEYLGNLMCYTKQEIPQTLSYNDGGIQGEVDRIDGNRVFLTINTGSTEGDAQNAVMEALYACVTQGGSASLTVEAANGSEINIASVTGVNITGTGVITYEVLGANILTGTSPEIEPIESISYTCSIAPTPEQGKAYAKNNDEGLPVWYDHITHTELDATQTESLGVCEAEGVQTQNIDGYCYGPEELLDVMFGPDTPVSGGVNPIDETFVAVNTETISIRYYATGTIIGNGGIGLLDSSNNSVPNNEGLTNGSVAQGRIDASNNDKVMTFDVVAGETYTIRRFAGGGSTVTDFFVEIKTLNVGKAYGVFSEDHTFIEYRDSITHEAIDSSLVYKCGCDEACNQDLADKIAGNLEKYEVECEGQNSTLWTYITECGPNVQDACNPSIANPNAIVVGNITAGVHPTSGLEVVNYVVFSVCSVDEPILGNNGLSYDVWLPGSADDYNTYTFNRTAPDPVCETGETTTNIGTLGCLDSQILDAIKEIKSPHTIIARCYEEDANPGTFKKVFEYFDVTTFPATIVGHTEEDMITVFDTTGWTVTDSCNCKNC